MKLSFFTTTVQYNVKMTADAALIYLTISRYTFSSLVNKTLRHWNSFIWGSIPKVHPSISRVTRELKPIPTDNGEEVEYTLDTL